MQIALIVQPSWFDWLTVLAIVVGPVLALSAQRLLDMLREKKKAKENIFFAIMRHRGQWYHVERIQALNSIEVVFAGDKAVMTKWRAFIDHVRTPKPKEDDGAKNWDDNLDTAVCDLSQAIGNSLGYKLDLKQIRQGAYTPQLHSNIDTAQVAVWLNLAQALRTGELLVRVKEGADDADADVAAAGK